MQKKKQLLCRNAVFTDQKKLQSVFDELFLFMSIVSVIVLFSNRNSSVSFNGAVCDKGVEIRLVFSPLKRLITLINL